MTWSQKYVNQWNISSSNLVVKKDCQTRKRGKVLSLFFSNFSIFLMCVVIKVNSFSRCTFLQVANCKIVQRMLEDDNKNDGNEQCWSPPELSDWISCWHSVSLSVWYWEHCFPSSADCSSEKGSLQDIILQCFEYNRQIFILRAITMNPWRHKQELESKSSAVNLSLC